MLRGAALLIRVGSPAPAFAFLSAYALLVFFSFHIIKVGPFGAMSLWIPAGAQDSVAPRLYCPPAVFFPATFPADCSTRLFQVYTSKEAGLGALGGGSKIEPCGAIS